MSQTDPRIQTGSCRKTFVEIPGDFFFDNGIRSRKKHSGFRQDLPLLYAGAVVFVFPSWYEGFGLPPLEAMKCGTPVIVSNRSSLPEIVGNEGLMVNPDDIQELSDMIIKVVSDPDFRKKISLYYLKRSKMFSWERCITETRRSYEKALSE